MSTALSSTEQPVTRGRLSEVVRSISDVGALLRFRSSGLRGKARRYAVAGLAVMLGLTVAAAVVPAYFTDAVSVSRRTDVLSLLPTVLLGVLFISVASAAASAGGRELMPREQGVAYPVTPLTDHLGALLMAPLNIAWLLQAWLLLGATALIAGPHWSLAHGQLVILGWLVAATCVAQVVGWCMEWVRRGPGGVWLVRGISAVVVLLGAFLIATDRLVGLLERSPTVQVTTASLQGTLTGRWFVVVAVLLVATTLAIAAGGFVAGAVADRPARDVLKVESSPHQARPMPGNDLVALIRMDRVGIWRSVGLRRGLIVLAVMPGAVAVAGGLHWDMMMILPGLVASGGALLFGVNSWCVDGRGALWRDTLPVDPYTVFFSRVIVLCEVLSVAAVATLVMASLRAGLPNASELVGVLSCAAVVVVQVVSGSLRWSVRRPYAVDLRSARATPAPPLTMVGYSARLALSTTMVGLLFSVLAQLPWQWPLMFAIPMLLFSAYRLAKTAGAWADPDIRCRVVSTVAN